MDNRTKLNLSLLAESHSKRTGAARSECEDFARTFFDTITKALQDEELVKIKGFGTFKKVQISARESVDVNTGNRILIDAYTKIQFVPEQSVKDIINAPFSSFSSVQIEDNDSEDALKEKFSVMQESDEEKAENEEEKKIQADIIEAGNREEKPAATVQPAATDQPDDATDQQPAATDQPDDATDQQPANPEDTQDNVAAAKTPSKKKCKAGWTVLIVLLVLLLAAAVYYVLTLYNLVEPLDLSFIGIDFPKSE